MRKTNSSATNSSVYASRRGHKITDLNKSAENSRKYNSNLVGTKVSNTKVSPESNVLNIQEGEQEKFNTSNQSMGQSNLNLDQSRNEDGIKNNYLQSSVDRLPADEYSYEQWDGQNQAEFENLTLDSVSSLGSIPDEYCVYQSSKPKEKPKETVKDKPSHQPKPSIGEVQDYSLKYASAPNPKTNTSQVKGESIPMSPQEVIEEKKEDENVDTEMDNDVTQDTGNESKYSLQVPSMITHLKRKDTYLNSLDNFLNENLNTIADLIKIKKEATMSLKQCKRDVECEKDNLAAEQKRRKKLEKNIAHTIEENYCLRYQNDEQIKLIERVRDKIAQKYVSYEKEIEDLFMKKQEIKERLREEIRIESDQNLRVAEINKALKPTKTDAATDRLTSNEYQLDCLRKIVDNEKQRVGQRLDVVREKSKLLNQLVNNEDVDDSTNENSVIKRGLWNLLNN